MYPTLPFVVKLREILSTIKYIRVQIPRIALQLFRALETTLDTHVQGDVREIINMN